MGMNYCPFCGSQLVENAKFCSQCGKPVPDVQNGENQEKETVQRAPEVVDTLEPQTTSLKPDPIHTIKIGKYDLQVTESMIAYNKVRSYFVDYAEHSRDKFESLYDNEVHDLETLYDKALPAIIEQSTSAIPFAVSVLGRYSLVMGPDEFIRIAKENIHLGADLHEYVETAEQLDNFTQRLSSYRARNRSGNIQWQGGGFGLKGAIGGALMAGALNLATDAVRGVGHAVVDSADRARLKKLQIDIYKSRDHKKHLGKVLYGFCMSLFDPAVRLLEENGLIIHPPFNIEAGIGPISEAFDLVNQKHASRENYEKALKLTLQNMPYDPYFVLSYLTLYKIPDIDNKELLKLVKLFGIEASFQKKIKEYEESMLEDLASMPEDSLDDIDKKILKADELNRIFCYSFVSTQILRNKKQAIIAQSGEQNKEEIQSALLVAFEGVNLNIVAISKALLNNIVFQEIYSILTRDAEGTKKLIQEMYNLENIILIEKMSLYQGKLLDMRNRFAPYASAEIPTIYLKTKRCEEGFLLSNQKIYLKEQSGAPLSIPLNEIRSIDCANDGSWIRVNNSQRIELAEESINRLGYRRFVHLILFFIKYSLFLVATQENYSESFFEDVLKVSGVSREEFKAKLQST